MFIIFQIYIPFLLKTIQRSGDLFLRDRMQPRKAWQNFEEYRQAIARFPNARSCFPSEITDSRSINTLDSREFDWNEMKTKADVEVCIFRIAIALSAPEKVEAWLRYFNFTVSRYREFGGPLVPNIEQGGGRGFIIRGGQSLRHSRLLYRGRVIDYIFRSVFVYEHRISITYDSTGLVVGASIYELIL